MSTIAAQHSAFEYYRGMATDVLVVLCTFPVGDEAVRAAEILVGERLAACVNLVPTITSVYRWQGQVQRDQEQLAILKTTADQLAALERRLVELNPYDTPEVLALAVEGGHLPYLTWVRDATGTP